MGVGDGDLRIGRGVWRREALGVVTIYGMLG